MSYSHLLPGEPVRYGERVSDKPRQQPKALAPPLPGWVRGETGWRLGSDRMTPTASSPETLSDGLRGNDARSACGPGRYLSPRNPPIVRHLSVDKFPFSADIDRELGGEEPPVRRPPPSHHRGDAPPSEKNPPHRHRVRRIAEDGSHGVAQELAESVVGDARDDMMSQLGPEHWSGERPDAKPGPTCEHCHQTMTPGPPGSTKRFCSDG